MRDAGQPHACREVVGSAAPPEVAGRAESPFVTSIAAGNPPEQPRRVQPSGVLDLMLRGCSIGDMAEDTGLWHTAILRSIEKADLVDMALAHRTVALALGFQLAQVKEAALNRLCELATNLDREYPEGVTQERARLLDVQRRMIGTLLRLPSFPGMRLSDSSPSERGPQSSPSRASSGSSAAGGERLDWGRPERGHSHAPMNGQTSNNGQACSNGQPAATRGDWSAEADQAAGGLDAGDGPERSAGAAGESAALSVGSAPAAGVAPASPCAMKNGSSAASGPACDASVEPGSAEPSDFKSSAGNRGSDGGAPPGGGDRIDGSDRDTDSAGRDATARSDSGAGRDDGAGSGEGAGSGGGTRTSGGPGLTSLRATAVNAPPQATRPASRIELSHAAADHAFLLSMDRRLSALMDSVESSLSSIDATKSGNSAMAAGSMKSRETTGLMNRTRPVNSRSASHSAGSQTPGEPTYPVSPDDPPPDSPGDHPP